MRRVSSVEDVHSLGSYRGEVCCLWASQEGENEPEPRPPACRDALKVEARLFLGLMWPSEPLLFSVGAQTSRHRTAQLPATQEILVPSRGPWWLSTVSCLLQSTQAHENNRDIRLAWTGIQEHLVSTGFNQVVVPPALTVLPAGTYLVL